MYFAIYDRLKQNAEKDRCMSKRKLFEILGRLYLLPKKYRYVVLKELINYGFIVDLGDRVEIKKCKNALEDSSKVYRKAKMF